jgi:hypothetical protein
MEKNNLTKQNTIFIGYIEEEKLNTKILFWSGEGCLFLCWEIPKDVNIQCKNQSLLHQENYKYILTKERNYQVQGFSL